MHPAIAAIVGGPEAWTSAEALASAGFDEAELATLQASGLAAPWELPLPYGLQWTLTPLGAFLSGVCLDGAPRWVDRPLNVLVRRGPCHARCAPGQCRLRLPERVPDRAPGPEEMVDSVSERAVRIWGERVEIARHRLRGKR